MKTTMFIIVIKLEQPVLNENAMLHQQTQLLDAKVRLANLSAFVNRGPCNYAVTCIHEYEIYPILNVDPARQ